MAQLYIYIYNTYTHKHNYIYTDRQTFQPDAVFIHRLPDRDSLQSDLPCGPGGSAPKPESRAFKLGSLECFFRGPPCEVHWEQRHPFQVAHRPPTQPAAFRRRPPAPPGRDRLRPGRRSLPGTVSRGRSTVDAWGPSGVPLAADSGSKPDSSASSRAKRRETVAGV